MEELIQFCDLNIKLNVGYKISLSKCHFWGAAQRRMGGCSGSFSVLHDIFYICIMILQNSLKEVIQRIVNINIARESYCIRMLCCSSQGFKRGVYYSFICKAWCCVTHFLLRCFLGDLFSACQQSVVCLNWCEWKNWICENYLKLFSFPAEAQQVFWYVGSYYQNGKESKLIERPHLTPREVKRSAYVFFNRS